MPRPPPAIPALVCVCGGGSCPLCAGSGWLSSRPTGALCAGGIEPVASGLLRAEGSPKREVSPLQAATPIVISASTAARGSKRAHHACARNNSATPHIPDPLIRRIRDE